MSIITPDQSRQARRELGLSQAAVAEATALNRQYISEYETGHTSRLTNGNQRKLRAFYEGKITEAREAGEEIDIDFGDAEAKPLAKVETFEAKRCIFPVAHEVTDEQLASAFATIAENDKTLVGLLTGEQAREQGFFGPGELTAETLESLRKSFALLSANYLIVRSIGGWPEIGLSAQGLGGADGTLLESIMGEVRESFEKAGLALQVTDETKEEAA